MDVVVLIISVWFFGHAEPAVEAKYAPVTLEACRAHGAEVADTIRKNKEVEGVVVQCVPVAKATTS